MNTGPDARLTDLPAYIFGTTRLGGDDVARDQQAATARAALEWGLWLHTSRQYGHALEVLGDAIAETATRPSVIVKIGGGTADNVRATVRENLEPLGLPSVTLGQLSPVDGLGAALAQGLPVLDDLRRLKDEGLVGRYVLEIFPWTSEEPLAALRAGHLEGLIDGFILYINPLQRFASNALWDELQSRGEPLISMRTVGGAPVHVLRDLPGAAWRPYLQQRAVEVAPIFERSGIPDWATFCGRYAHTVPNVRSTVGSTVRREHLETFVALSEHIEPLPADVMDEIAALQRRWSDETDVRAEPWTM